jgi:hypothetical protein
LLVAAHEIDEDCAHWYGLKCFACGSRVDQLIAHHRRLPTPPEP